MALFFSVNTRMGKSLDGVLVKKAFAKQRYTLEQVKHLEACLDPVDGPLYFCSNFLKIQHPVKGSIPFKPYPYQEELLKAYHNHRYTIAMLPRQSGKTTCASGYLLWYTMFVPEAQVLIAAHKYTGAQDIMNRYRYGYENLPDFIRAGVHSYNRNTIEYDNGSRIQATTTTENTGRGKSLSLIYCLDGDTTKIKVRNKQTLIEEEMTLAELYCRISDAKKIIV